MSSIVLEFIKAPDGGEILLVPKARIEATKRRYEARVKELRKVVGEMDRAIAKPTNGMDIDAIKIERDAKEREAAFTEAECTRIVEQESKIRAKFEKNIEKVEYPFKPYNDGGKQDAIAECTDYSSGSPRLDVPKYQRMLVASTTGLSIESIRELSPSRAEALVSEVIDRSEPDPLRLDFLS